jgi:hypothetical protein
MPNAEYERIKTEHTKLSRSGVKAVAMKTRDEGFEYETNDCFVKAVQAVTGVPYRDAHTYVAKRFGRKPKKATMSVNLIMRDIATTGECIFGFRAFVQPASQVGTTSRVSVNSYGQRTRYTRARYATLAEFVRTHRTGRWLLWSNNHAFAMVDGVVYDNGAAGARTQVTGVNRIIASSEVEAQEKASAAVAHLTVNQRGF